MVAILQRKKNMASPNNSFNDHIIDQFRANGGEVDRFGRDLVLVHHIGARSGEERIAPVMGIRSDADTWLIAASKAGAPENPGWYHNLLANPDVTIETADDGAVEVRVTDLEGEERDAAWERFKERSAGFRSYEEKTSRLIPVLALTRR
ncbi:MAG: nitroreductase/quinone reductase family protein [Microbacterium pygmaeum]